ncbi:hypothetical protein UAW_01799 [Enterococcus haemoperoxidus ATCC BAA-382]|uniref:Uncharacterized protein n=1 Tax=Enterococcus haemoperoxidus ATCC BAA-382 TaxID=1158608 RepID=R2T8S5_9ENTE|nr:hypothetical protein [Enterococcus haemoperoxidus]EOH96634.1 hypothetical protein UAW_01799 [Enterococcus haemoperoxidus ATCC BAA-382]EOT60130.1 hypothetical protein I583_02765 [Enterococcus haemoperoxidus ATCC BAA-382]OJG51462.1 hypothetical protein RV06_GL001603 [Enterococcus haemoperoxidus]
MKKKKNHSKRKRLIILISTVVAVTILLAFLFFRGLKTSAIHYDAQAVKYEAKIKKPENLPINSITFPGFRDIAIQEGDKVLYIALVNPSFNKADIQFKVTLNDRTTPILTTGLVKPGQAVTEVPLPKELPVGEHTVKLEMFGYTQDEVQQRLTGSQTTFKLQVLKNKP